MRSAGDPAVRTAPTADVGRERLGRIRALLEAAFADRPEGPFDADDWSHCLGGVHCWVEEDGEVLAHASVVLRRLLHHPAPLHDHPSPHDHAPLRGERILRCGYVEAVAVRADRRRGGFGTAVLAAAERLVRGGYELGALGATEQGAPLYRSRGWQPWRGRLGHLATDGVRDDPAERGKILVLPVDGVPLDLDGVLIAGPREGDPW